MFQILLLIIIISLLLTFYIILVPAFILWIIARVMNFYDRNFGTAVSIIMTYVVITIAIEFVYGFLAIFIDKVLYPISPGFSLIFIMIISILIPVIVLSGLLEERYDATRRGAILASIIVTSIEIIFVFAILPVILGGNYDILRFGDPGYIASFFR